MDNLTTSETMKYRKVYREGVYPPEASVGAGVVPIAWGWMRGLGCRTATDYGCGHGRATRWLRSQEECDAAWGIDLIRTTEMKADDHFVQGPLWHPPDRIPETDFAFSADVLEHLPTEKVGHALTWMASLTRIGGWFQIATIPDEKGKEVGETLHLTVKDERWWYRKVSQYFFIQAAQVTDREVRLWVTTG